MLNIYYSYMANVYRHIYKKDKYSETLCISGGQCVIQRGLDMLLIVLRAISIRIHVTWLSVSVT